MTDDVFDPDEHSAQGLLAKLAQTDVGAGPWEVDLTRRLLSMYEAHGLLRDGRARPLYEACDACIDCWAGAVPKPPAWRAEISVPWIGSGYRESGICAIAINLNKYGPLGANWWIVRGHIHDRLGKGSRRNFEFRVGQYLAAIRASQEGRWPIRGEIEPQLAARGWEDCAFFEAVKCSPESGVSAPTGTMWENCPPRYVLDELEILRPRVVVAIGVGVGNWARRLLGVEDLEVDRPGLRRGPGRLAGEDVDVICLNHPSFGNWKSSRARLFAMLGSSEDVPASGAVRR
ncbi:MAG: hypothetical protein JJE35_04045 [Thermoleophilia bacterium]|nr:hypothetical protein [Thermoleophilia bacterium]